MRKAAKTPFVTSDVGKQVRKAQAQATKDVASELTQRQKMQKSLSSQKKNQYAESKEGRAVRADERAIRAEKRTIGKEKRAAGKEETLAKYTVANPKQSSAAFQKGAGQALGKAGYGTAGSEAFKRGTIDDELIMRRMFDALEKNQPQLAQTFAQQIGYKLDGDMLHNAKVGQAYGALMDIVENYSGDPEQKQFVTYLVKTLVDRGIKDNIPIDRDGIMAELTAMGISPKNPSASREERSARKENLAIGKEETLSKYITDNPNQDPAAFRQGAGQALGEAGYGTAGSALLNIRGNQPSRDLNEYQRYKMGTERFTTGQGSLEGEKLDAPGLDAYMSHYGYAPPELPGQAPQQAPPVVPETDESSWYNPLSWFGGNDATTPVAPPVVPPIVPQAPPVTPPVVQPVTPPVVPPVVPPIVPQAPPVVPVPQAAPMAPPPIPLVRSGEIITNPSTGERFRNVNDQWIKI